jgi:4'-phosphopantetheinyl transferase EntD
VGPFAEVGLAAILPAGAAVAEVWDDCEETDVDPAQWLLGRESEAVADAVAGRRREFAHGRMCAREALRKLGVEPVELPVGADGSTLWPPGVLGSITHKGAYRAAAVAWREEIPELGIDAELSEPLPAGVLERIATRQEVEMVGSLAEVRPEVHWDRLLFSAKESVYKAVSGSGEGGLSLQDFAVELGLNDRVLLDPGCLPVRGLSGRWVAPRQGLLLTAVAGAQRS